MCWLKIFYILLLITLFYSSISSKTDKTLLDKAKGKDVVEAVEYLIKSSGIFLDDYGLLTRLAFVVSEFGEDPNTFTQKHNIWGIDNIAFLKSSPYLPKINQIFGVDFNNIQLNDLSKPLIGGLAISIFFTQHQPVPIFLEDQGKYINQYFSSSILAQDFVNKVRNMEKIGKCSGRMDLAIVLDGSGSIGADNFKLAQTFVSNLVDTFSLSNVNLGFVLFSAVSQIIIPFDSNLPLANMKTAILNSGYPASGTNTSGAIYTARDMLLKAKQRDGIPKIMAIFTDGQPNNPVDNESDLAIKSNITLFAIGIGSSISQANLLSMVKNQTNRVVSMSSYKSLSESFDAINGETCKISQKPDVGKKIVDVLIKNEKRYFCYDLPSQGITVTIDVKVGKTDSYYSYTQQNPSSALNDGTIDGQAYIPVPKSQFLDTTIKRVCVTIEGIEIKNNFTIISEKGDVTIPDDNPIARIKNNAKEIAKNAFNNLKDYNQIANQICNELSKMYSKDQWICIVGEKVQISEHQIPNDLFQFGFSMGTADVFIIVNVP